jgi:K+-transporting ATPase ATPase A chain
MSGMDVIRLLVPVLALFALAAPVGHWIARIFGDEPTWTSRIFGPLERALLRLLRIHPLQESGWRRYALDALAFHAVGALVLYGLLRLQHVLPWNDRGFAAVAPELAFNTALSFITNTNWQAYGGESSLTNFVQAVGLGTQNFLSAAVGIAVAIALFRALERRGAKSIGNFYADVIRASVQVLLPLSLVLGVALVAQGVPQTLESGFAAAPLEGDSAGAFIPVGPVASQVAIKQLGTNGGGFFNANSAHPLENPTPLSNLLEWLSILLLPAALCFTFGRMVRDPRQGRTLFAAMAIPFLLALFATVIAENRANPRFDTTRIDARATDRQPGGNPEGKETRFGTIDTAAWAVATTAASNGSVNGMHDSLLPLAGAIPLMLIQLGEVVFGGVGSGIYGMLLFVILAVFVAGLMVGRTPEYLGKKIEAFETKVAILGILLPSAAILVGTACATSLDAGRQGVANPGAHGFSEILYAFSSASGNNGSAFGGLAANTPFFDLALGICMWIGRFGVLIPVLALAGALAAKKPSAPGPGTLPTHGPLFTSFLIAIVVLVGALTFVPALMLGPIAEHFQLFTR